jgi:hypothetical protein
MSYPAVIAKVVSTSAPHREGLGTRQRIRPIIVALLAVVVLAAVLSQADADSLPQTSRASIGNFTDVSQAELPVVNAPPIGKVGFWGDAWKVAKCAGSIAAAVGTFAIPASKLLKLKSFIKSVGGVRDAAKLLVGATSRSEKLSAIGKAGVTGGAEILGIKEIQDNC